MRIKITGLVLINIGIGCIFWRGEAAMVDFFFLFVTFVGLLLLLGDR